MGPAKWLAEHCQDGAGPDEHYRAKARAIDLPVRIHQGVPHAYLERGAKGIIELFVEVVDEVRRKDDALLLVGYDRKELVALIKDREQAGRTRAAGDSATSFNRQSTSPIKPTDFRPWLRRDGKAARDGIANALTAATLYDEARWTGPNCPKGDVRCVLRRRIPPVPAASSARASRV